MTHNRTWRFDAVDQMTATNTIDEIVDFNSTLWMDFSLALEEDSIDSIDSHSVSPASGLTLGTLVISNTQQHIELPVTNADEGTYTVTIGITSTQGDTIFRRGIVTIGATGT